MKKSVKIMAVFCLAAVAVVIFLLLNRTQSEVNDSVTYINTQGNWQCASAPDGVFYLFRDETGCYYIRYIDYKTGKDVAVCNKPDCSHDNEECNAFYCKSLETGMIMDMFVYNNKLYVKVMEEDSDASGWSSMSLYEQDFDGENRRKLFSTDHESIQDIVIYDNKMFFMTNYTNRDVIKAFEGMDMSDITSEEYDYLCENQCSSLCEYDIDKSTLTVLYENLGIDSVEGLFNMIIPSDEQSGFYFIQNYGEYNNQVTGFYFYDFESKTYEECWKELQNSDINVSNSNMMRIYDKHLYFFGYEGKYDPSALSICDYNIESGELDIIADVTERTREEFHMDNKIFINFGYGEDTDYACQYQRWVYLDIEDGELYMPDEGGHYPKYSSGDKGVIDYTDYYSYDVYGQDFDEYDYVIKDMEDYYKKYKKYNNEYKDALFLR